MAIDFLILILIIISLFVNLLALGAFWVTPGLRTMANRFVINLLIINIIGCCILTPPLFIKDQQLNSVNNNNNNNNNLNKINEKNNYLSEILINNNKKNDNNQHQLQQQQQQNINNKEKSVIEEEEDGIDIVNGTIIQSKTIMKCIGENCEKIYLKNSKNSETIVITEMKLNNDEDTLSSTSTLSTSSSSLENQQNINNNYENYYYKISSKIIRKQRWFIDLAAALGSLSVLLVVGDTWCAVTDPLRYHTRISALKSWILIACTWSFGIIFGLVSALLENIVTSTKTTTITETETLEKLIDPTTNIPIINTENYIYDLNTNYNIEDNNIENKFQYTNNENILTTFSSLSSSSEHLYSMIYSCIYFIVIILLPFGFVCGMYWRIFSEARKNGLRMRQNGSSPLLQSALNLSNTINNNNHHQQQQLQQHHHHHNSTNGLTMKIDRKNSNDKDVLNPLLPPPPQQPPTQQHQPKSSSSSQSVQINNNNNSNRTQDDCNIGKQNIFLTLSKANDDIKRNSSVQQLRLLDTSSQDLNETQKLSGIRHCQSTPTLLKKNNNNNNNNGNERNNSFCEQIISYTTSLSSSQHHHHHHHNALQLPPLHASPKTLSYMTSIRHRLSNASSLFKYREESRAARISILVVIMFLVSYLPYGILILLQELYYNKILLNNSIQLTIIMILIANFSSPFIFAYRNKRVRRGCKRLFGLDKTNTKQLQLNHNLKFFKCYSTHNKTIKNKKLQLKRNTSKLSNYSTNSKYLTPSCFKNHNNDNNDNDNINKINDNNNGILNDTFLNDFEKNLNIKNHNKKNLIEKIHFKTNHINCNTISAIQEKRSFLKIVCDSSRKLGCGTNSCANSDNEQVDV